MNRVKKVKRAFKLSKARWRDIVDTTATGLGATMGIIVFVILVWGASVSTNGLQVSWPNEVFLESIPMHINRQGKLFVDFLDRYVYGDLTAGFLFIAFMAVVAFISLEQGCGPKRNRKKFYKIKRERQRRTKWWLIGSGLLIMVLALITNPTASKYDEVLYDTYRTYYEKEVEVDFELLDEEIFVETFSDGNFHRKNLLIGSLYVCPRHERIHGLKYVYFGVFGQVLRLK